MAKRGRRPRLDGDSPFERLVNEVRVTNVLLAASLRNHLGQNEIVRLLSAQTTLSAREMASILGTSAATVQVTVSRWRKQQQSEQDVKHGKENTPEAALREAGLGPERQGLDVVSSGRDAGLDGSR